jgi:hypothetical protein
LRRAITVGEIAVMLTGAELMEVGEWATAFMADAAEAFEEGSPGLSAYEKITKASDTIDRLEGRG